MVFLKDFFKQFDFEKNQGMTKMHSKPGRQRVEIFHFHTLMCVRIKKKIQIKPNKCTVKTEASLGFCLCWSECSLSAGVKHVSRCSMAVLIKCWALSILLIVPCSGLKICFITTVARISNQCALP